MEAYALTDTGRVRTMNQDYIYSSPEKVGSLPNLFLVADGMGGHRAGDYASRFAVENLVIYINRAGDGSPVMQLKKGIETVNGMLYEESLKREELKGMGCTLVAGVVEDNILYVANVGDSRLYLIHGDSIRQVTRDHSYVEEMRRRGKITEADARTHPQKNLITRAVGVEPYVEGDLFEVRLNEKDMLLLCSDGLTGMAEDSRIAEVLANAPTLELAGDALLQLALDGGGRDNITVALFTLGKKQGA